MLRLSYQLNGGTYAVTFFEEWRLFHEVARIESLGVTEYSVMESKTFVDRHGNSKTRWQLKIQIRQSCIG